jgi:hypothetical protein
VIRSRHRAYGVQPCTSKLASDWELFVTLRKQKNKEMKRLKRLCSHGMPTRLPPTVEEGAWIQGSLAGSSCATRDPDPCPQIVRPYAKASEPRMERSNSRGNTTVFRDISSLVPHWCAESTRTTLTA